MSCWRRSSCGICDADARRLREASFKTECESEEERGEGSTHPAPRVLPSPLSPSGSLSLHSSLRFPHSCPRWRARCSRGTRNLAVACVPHLLAAQARTAMAERAFFLPLQAPEAAGAAGFRAAAPHRRGYMITGRLRRLPVPLILVLARPDCSARRASLRAEAGRRNEADGSS